MVGEKKIKVSVVSSALVARYPDGTENKPPWNGPVRVLGRIQSLK